jgi:diaminopimelate decarboxylase
VDADNIADLVGPICESTDFIAKGRAFPQVGPGDFLSVMSAGAYGFAMSSTYNSQPRPAEVLVSGDKYYIVRERESFEQLIAGEQLPAFLKEA